MSVPTIDQTTAQFLAHLHRAGNYNYLWTSKGDEKRTHWYEPGRIGPVPNSQHNVYFNVNPCSSIPTTTKDGKPVRPEYVRSRTEHVAAINCVFAEFDAKDFNTGKAGALEHIQGLPISPSVTIDSGGGYHCYWLFDQPFLLTTDDDRARADRAQKGWVKLVGGDDGAKDLPRVLRLPGSENYKYSPPRPVEYVSTDFDRLYTLGDIEALIPPEPVRPARTTRQHTEHEETPTAAVDDTVDFATIAEVATLFARLSPTRRDTYTEWLKVGMAVRALEHIGFYLWEKWSKTSPKYKVGDCAAKWKTFHVGTPGVDLTIDSLRKWAKDDDPDGLTGDVVPRDEHERVKAERDDLKREEVKRVQILKNPMLGDREKVAWLAMCNTVDIRLALQKDGAIRLSGDDVGFVMGRAASTGNRAIRSLEEHGVLICDPATVTRSDDRTIQQMRVNPGPAFDNVDLVQPATSKQKRGGARPGAGRKPACPDCPLGTTHRKVTTRSVSYYCQVHGLIAEEALPDLIEDYLSGDVEIKIDCDATADAEGSDPEIKIDFTPADPEINFDFTPPADCSPAAECRIASVVVRGYLECNSAFSPDPEIKIDFTPADPEINFDFTTADPEIKIDFTPAEDREINFDFSPPNDPEINFDFTPPPEINSDFTPPDWDGYARTRGQLKPSVNRDQEKFVLSHLPTRGPAAMREHMAKVAPWEEWPQSVHRQVLQAEGATDRVQARGIQDSYAG
jgi:hypothetical protein